MASAEWITANEELEKMWKEAVLAYFEQLSREFPGESDDSN